MQVYTKKATVAYGTLNDNKGVRVPKPIITVDKYKRYPVFVILAF